MANSYCEAWDQVHPSPETDRRILAVLKEYQRYQGKVIPLHLSKPKQKRFGKVSAIAIAVAVTLALSVTAFAIANYTDFFEKVFGGTDAGTQSYDLPGDHWNEDGSQDTLEIITERVPVDRDTAQQVLDDSVSAPNTSITVGDYICWVEEVTVAENGVGVLTFSVENAKGLPEVCVFNETVKNFNFVVDDSGTGAEGVQLRGTPMFSAPEEWDDPMVDAISLLVTATDTRLEARTYFALHGDKGCPASLDVYFFQNEGKEYCLSVPLPEPAEAVVLTGSEGWTASISPMGLAITAPEGIGSGYGSGDITIHYDNGEEYVVITSEPYIINTYLTCLSEGGTTRYVFNRLIDPAEVSSVTGCIQSYATEELKDITFMK